MKLKHAPLYLAVAAAVGSYAFPQSVAAQNPGADQVLEEVVVTGTRAPGRSAEDLPVPVDVLNAEQLANTGQTELGRMLQAIAPPISPIY